MSHSVSTRALVFITALLPLATACDAEMSARVREAGELAEGSPVTLAGARVGEVKSIEVTGGDVPVLVHFSVNSDNKEAILAGACSRTNGSRLVLQARPEMPVVDEQVNACEPSLLEGLRGAGELLRGAVQGIREGVQGNGIDGPGTNPQGQDPSVDEAREAARQAGQLIRGAAEGASEGLGDEAARELGISVGREAEQFRRGVQEGVDIVADPPAAGR